MLKTANVLPPGNFKNKLKILDSKTNKNRIFDHLGAPSCGLISKSDAERLCAMLFFNVNLFPSHIQAKFRNPYALGVDLDKKEIQPEDLQPKLKYELKKSPIISQLIKNLPDDIRQLAFDDQILSDQQKREIIKSTLTIQVTHRCFGKGRGLLIPAFYTRYDSRCIICINCNFLFSPSKFVCHTHRQDDNNYLCKLIFYIDF